MNSASDQLRHLWARVPEATSAAEGDAIRLPAPAVHDATAAITVATPTSPRPDEARAAHRSSATAEPISTNHATERLREPPTEETVGTATLTGYLPSHVTESPTLVDSAPIMAAAPTDPLYPPNDALATRGTHHGDCLRTGLKQPTLPTRQQEPALPTSRCSKPLQCAQLPPWRRL